MGKTNKTKLKKIFDKIDIDKRTVVNDLIENAIYTADLLVKIKDEINSRGVTSYTAAGNITESPLVKSYNALLKSYSSIISQLVRYLPEKIEKDDIDSLSKFFGDDD